MAFHIEDFSSKFWRRGRTGLFALDLDSAVASAQDHVEYSEPSCAVIYEVNRGQVGFGAGIPRVVFTPEGGWQRLG